MFFSHDDTHLSKCFRTLGLALHHDFENFKNNIYTSLQVYLTEYSNNPTIDHFVQSLEKATSDLQGDQFKAKLTNLL